MQTTVDLEALTTAVAAGSPHDEGLRRVMQEGGTATVRGIPYRLSGRTESDGEAVYSLTPPVHLFRCTSKLRNDDETPCTFVHGVYDDTPMEMALSEAWKRHAALCPACQGDEPMERVEVEA